MEKSEMMDNSFGYKCGEIYVNNDLYIYKCSFCSYNHRNIRTLKRHLSQKHGNISENITNKYSSNESIFNGYDEKNSIEENKHIGLETIYYSDLEQELNTSTTKIKIDIISNPDESDNDEGFKIFTIVDNELNSSESEEQIIDQQEELNKVKPEWTKCKFCSCRMYKHSLPNHIKTFHSDSEYNMTIMNNDAYENNINEFLCRFCNISFSTIEEINNHDKKCNSLHWTKCNDCGIFILKNELDLHMEENHNRFQSTDKSISNLKEDSLCCKVCNKNFTNNITFLQHENECFSINENIICNFCECSILKHNLKEHLINIHPEQLTNFECLSSSDYEKNNFEDDNNIIDDNSIIEQTYDNDLTIDENSTNKVKDLKIEILFDTNTEENLENYTVSSSPPPYPLKVNSKMNQSIITRSKARKFINNKYNIESKKIRNKRKLCTKCNRVPNDIYRHRKICSMKREWVTCIYCGCHMFKERLDRHINNKHSDKILQQQEQKSIENLNDYEYNENDDSFSKFNKYVENDNNDDENDNDNNSKMILNNKTKSCKHCGRMVVNILQHEFNCGQSKKRITCEICGKHIFQRNISKHMELHNYLINNNMKNISTINKNDNKCRYCNRNFNTRWGTIERHEKYCSNLMNREKCKYCKYSISKINMDKHLLNKHMDKDGNINKNILSTNYENYSENDYKNKLPCRYCNKLYLQPVLHEKHCQSRTGYKKEWTRCQICSALVQKLRLSIHMKRIHQIITDDNGNDIENQQHHTNSTTDYNIKAEFVKCILCGCHILLKNFQYHIFRIHKDRLPIKEHEILDYNKLSLIDLSKFRTTTIFPNWIKCKECGLMVAEPTLESHLEIHKKFGNLRGTNFQCNICKKKYPARRYEQHIRTAHLDETNSVFCNECDLKRIHNDYYDDHMKWHRGEIIGYECEKCNRRYELKYSLDRHMKIHEEKETCICPECGKTFPNKLRLTQHIQIHSTDAKYQCDTCGKAFIIKSRLQSHQLTHMDKKFYRFPCTLCNKRFSGKAKLSDHMITHTRTKNFKCDICDAKFARKFDAIKHQRRHTEIGHLMCSICEKRFFLKRPLKDHLKTQHSILDENAIIDTRIQQEECKDDMFYVTEMMEIDDEQNKVVSGTEGDYEIVMEFDL